MFAFDVFFEHQHINQRVFEGIPILPSYCLILSRLKESRVLRLNWLYAQIRKMSGTAVPQIKAGASLDLRHALRAELSAMIDRAVGAAEKRLTDVPGLTVVRRVKPTEPACLTYEPSLAVITRGRKEVVLGSRTFVYDESRYLLTSVDLPVLSRIPEASAGKPFVGLALKFDLGLVRELLSEVQVPGDIAAPNRPAMTTGETTVEILDACRRMVQLIGKPAEIGVLSGLIQREIIFRILQGPEGARLRGIATLGDQSHRTARAIEWIRANYMRPLRVESLAERSGMAVSTFHHHFRALTSMSPVQYQKQIRLQTARGRMVLDGLDAASAAFAVGYESASQFNREYRRLFGNPPMKDIRAVRERQSVLGGSEAAISE